MSTEPKAGDKATVSDRVGTWEVEKYDPRTGEGVLIAHSKVEIPFYLNQKGKFAAYNNAHVKFIANEDKKLESLKKYVCAAETLEDFLQRLEAVRADELGGLDDDLPEEE